MPQREASPTSDPAEHPYLDGGTRELMTALPAEAARFLLHMPECPSCQDVALGDLEKTAVLAAYLRRTCRVRFPGRQSLPWV